MEYSINTNRKTIYVEFAGSVDANSLIHHILTLRSDRYFQDGFNVILDFTNTNIPKGYMELAEVAEFVKATSVVRETFKMAILVATPDQLRSARLYALLVKQNHVLVCTNKSEAEEWVTMPSEVKNNGQPFTYFKL